ncbi:MAG: 3-isopropylmalate dehydratase small subunit [Thermodesulfobacteriota bacterium]
MRSFGGNVLFLNRSDINTDEIIPARYLTEISRAALKPHLLEDLELDGFEQERDLADRQVIVTRANFGCGSSREHAPWALEVNGIHLVIAESFARIFRQNMFNCGMLAIELAPAQIEQLFADFAGSQTRIAVDLESSTLTVTGAGNAAELAFTLSDFDRALVDAGGWIEFADANY